MYLGELTYKLDDGTITEVHALLPCHPLPSRRSIHIHRTVSKAQGEGGWEDGV